MHWPDRRSVEQLLVPPLAVWAAATATVVVACAADGVSPFSSQPWSWADAALYLDIAKHGLTLFPCGDQWCGNAGWFPAYPWLVGALHLLGLPLLSTAVVVSLLLHAGTLVVLWATFLERRLDARAGVALLFAAFAPGLVYHENVFPFGLVALCALLHFWFLKTERWWAAGIAGAVAVAAYPESIFLVATGLSWAATRRGTARERVSHALASAGTAAMGLVAVLVDARLEVGRWDAYLLVQRKYHHHWQQPFSSFRLSLHVVGHQRALALVTAPALQTILVVVLLAALLLALPRPWNAFDGLVTLWAVVTWLVPSMQWGVTSYRIEAMLLPVALLLRRLPTPVAVAFTVGAIVVAFPLARMYFHGQLT